MNTEENISIAKGIDKILTNDISDKIYNPNDDENFTD